MSHFVITLSCRVEGWGKALKRVKAVDMDSSSTLCINSPEPFLVAASSPHFLVPQGQTEHCWEPLKPRGQSSWVQSAPAPLCERLRQKEKLWQLLCQLSWPLPATLPGQEPGCSPISCPPAPPLQEICFSLMWSTGKCRWGVQCTWRGEKPQYMVFPCHGQKAHASPLLALLAECIGMRDFTISFTLIF